MRDWKKYPGRRVRVTRRQLIRACRNERRVFKGAIKNAERAELTLWAAVRASLWGRIRRVFDPMYRAQA